MNIQTHTVGKERDKDTEIKSSTRWGKEDLKHIFKEKEVIAEEKPITADIISVN